MSKYNKSFLLESINNISGAFILFLTLFFPFYLTAGYARSGTDKAVLLRNSSCFFAVLLAITLTIYLINNNRSITTFMGIPLKDKLKQPQLWILTYMFVNFISLILSSNREEAFSGTSGWLMGFITQSSLLFICFVISCYINLHDIYIYAGALISIVFYIWCILNRYDIYPIQYEYANTSFITSIGNINWYCGMFSIFFPLSAGYLWKNTKELISLISLSANNSKKTSKKKQKNFSYKPILIKELIATLTFCTGILAGILQGSDSAVIVFAVSFFLLLLLSGSLEERIAFYACLTLAGICCTLLWIFTNTAGYYINYDCVLFSIFTQGPASFILLIFSCVMLTIYTLLFKKEFTGKFITLINRCLLIVAVSIVIIFPLLVILNTNNPYLIPSLSNHSVFIFDDEWGSSRGVTWKAALTAFNENNLREKIIGCGPDSFRYAMYRQESSLPDLLTAHFGQSALTNAHNEPLTILINTGILGLIAFLGIIITYSLRLLSVIKDKNNSKYSLAAVYLLPVLSYFLHNMFSFEQPLNLPYFYIVIGLGLTLTRD